jgi:hypothetical protein
MEVAQDRGLRRALVLALLNPRDLLSENPFTKCGVVFNRSVIDRFVSALPEHHDYWWMFKLQRELWRLL